MSKYIFCTGDWWSGWTSEQEQSTVLGGPGHGSLGTWAAEVGNVGEERSYLQNIPGFERAI